MKPRPSRKFVIARKDHYCCGPCGRVIRAGVEHFRLKEPGEPEERYCKRCYEKLEAVLV